MLEIKTDKQKLAGIRNITRLWIDRMRNMKSPMAAISLFLYQSVMKNFKEGGRPSPWKRLADSTLARRRKKSTAILQDTGMLRMSIMPRSTENTASVGTNLIYARTHQYGARIHFKNRSDTVTIPKRQFLLIQDPADTVKILNFVRLFLYKGNAEGTA